MHHTRGILSIGGQGSTVVSICWALQDTSTSCPCRVLPTISWGEWFSILPDSIQSRHSLCKIEHQEWSGQKFCLLLSPMIHNSSTLLAVLLLSSSAHQVGSGYTRPPCQLFGKTVSITMIRLSRWGRAHTAVDGVGVLVGNLNAELLCNQS
jgi:hypothetical protein